MRSDPARDGKYKVYRILRIIHSGHAQYSILTLTLDGLLQGQDNNMWSTSLTNEIGRVSQGVGRNRPIKERIKGTNTIFFICNRHIPRNVKITYVNFICDIKPHKTESHRTRLTVGGNRLEYNADPSALAVGLLDTQIHLNSIISDANRGSQYYIVDTKITI